MGRTLHYVLRQMTKGHFGAKCQHNSNHCFHSTYTSVATCADLVTKQTVEIVKYTGAGREAV